MERPTLTRLLEDARSRRIDVVVVYKVDRLTRSLTDFAKIVDVFDEYDVSFVSVTQQINTTSSMGRLCAAVFRAVRARSNGGTYPRQDRRVQEEGHVDGRKTCGVPFLRGALYHLLQNEMYLGRIVHKDKSDPGLHTAIVDQELWEQAQATLASNRNERRTGKNAREPSLLAGLLFDDQVEAGPQPCASHRQGPHLPRSCARKPGPDNERSCRRGRCHPFRLHPRDAARLSGARYCALHRRLHTTAWSHRSQADRRLPASTRMVGTAESSRV